MSTPLVVFLVNKSNTFGLQQDCNALQEVWRKHTGKIQIKDPLEPPILCDIAVHFEIPIYGWMPWARMNVCMVNPEWWQEGWNPYLERMDALLFKCKADAAEFEKKNFQTLKHKPEIVVLPWTTSVRPSAFAKCPKATAESALWLLGASRAKRAAAQKVLPLWQESWPKLDVYTTTALEISPLAQNVTIHIRDLAEDTRRGLQAYSPLHLIFSEAEALGLAAFEGQAAGAFLLGNELPTYVEAFDGNSNVYLTDSVLVQEGWFWKDTFSGITVEALEKGIARFREVNQDSKTLRQLQEDSAEFRWLEFQKAAGVCVQNWIRSDLLKTRKKELKTLPPIVSDSELPSISVVTLLHNRRKFVDLAFHNLLITDYPKDKIEWVVVEDSDITEEQASDKILKFGRQAAPMSVTYIPLPKTVTIGEKRNLACKRAQHDIILMMDDDDHYPPTSFRRRVSWLIKHPWVPQVTCCTTIACYDLLKGTSAVNTPPWALPLCKRVSEATLTFRKSWWETGHFPEVNMAEGEGFLGKEQHEVLELPPQQIIVAMSHNKNSSSRRIPPGPSGKPSCFWGFPPDFLKFLHGLAGVTVEG